MAKKKEKLKLTRAEKKQLQELMTRSQQQNAKKVPRTAQATIPYQRMWPDGICRVTDNYYTKTIQFQDINYQLAQNDDKTSIFEGWCDFLNYFDASIHLQFSFLNLTASAESFEQSIIIPDKDDGFNDVRHEYAEMLQNQLAKGNNGLTKTKFITYGIEAENFKAAKPRLERIEIDLLNNFKRLGVAASPLDGRERLKLMHDMFHMDTQAPFQFDWKWLAPTGLSTKDFIAPASFDFRAKNTFGMGSKQGEVSFFSILAADLNDRCLADFLAMESSLIVSLHIQAIDQVAAIKDVKRKITDLDKMKIEEQKKAVRAGYDMDIIPSDLATYGGEAKKLLEDLQSRNERMFLITFLVLNTADNAKQLSLNVKQAQRLAQQHNCQLIPLDFQQESGMVSCLPLGHNAIRIQRGLTTSSTAIFVPFTTQELFQTSKEALYCGLNALSNNLIMVDRKWLKNPNGLILGTPGSGKSFAAKREIAYQLRQSFKPGEVSAEEANQIGYELAERLLSGEHAFIVATHTDRQHIHNHIVFCATALDCSHKFRNVWNSSRLVAEISDELCREHHLSVVQVPQNKTVSYEKWEGDQSKLTSRDSLRITIDTALRLQPDGFDALMQLMEEAGCWIKRGAHVSIKPPGGERYIRLDSLGAEYSEAALRKTLDGQHVHIPKIPRSEYTYSQVKRLIDIETKLRDGMKGRGYIVWAERNNIDAKAQSIIFLKEHNIGSIEELDDQISALRSERNSLYASIREKQNRMKEINQLRQAIRDYRRTKDVYAQYKASGWSPKFYNEHRAEIEDHKKAQAVYSSVEGKMPTLKELSAEYEALKSEKEADDAALEELKPQLTTLNHIKYNFDVLERDYLPEEKDPRQEEIPER